MRHSLSPLILFAMLLMAPSQPWLSVERDGFRVLMSEHGAQTISKMGGRTGYYYDLGERAGEMRPRARRVVMLGLGGGEMLRAARRTLPKASLVGVDIDRRVVHAAVTEFRIGDFGAVAEVDDGRQYVKKLRGIDVLISDMFDDDRMVGVSPEFFADCKAALAPGGLLMVNVYPEAFVAPVVNMLQRAGFAVASTESVRGSTVIFAER